MAIKKRTEHEIPAVVHFSTGALIVLAIAFLSASLHNRSILNNPQLTNLDLYFLSHWALQGSGSVAIVAVTDDDYHDLFGNRSPLDPQLVTEIIGASAKSGARVIGVDFDTSDWTAQQREAARAAARMESASVRLVWAVEGWTDAKAGAHIQKLAGLDQTNHVDCEAAPAAMPDNLGFVRGFYPGLQVTGHVQPSDQGSPMVIPGMATLIDAIYKGLPGCMPKESLDALSDNQERLVNYSGGIANFPRFSAATVLNVVKTAPGEDKKSNAWLNSNPLMGKMVLIGGSYRQARDRYLTPAGFMDGVDILGQTVLSIENKITATPRTIYILGDLLVGFALLTSTWFFERGWVLVLAFLLIPVVAVISSYAVFLIFGSFVSFIPLVAGIFFHHLVEYVWEDWKLRKEVAELRQHVKAARG